MAMRQPKRLGGLFFCLAGIVCAGPAALADEADLSGLLAQASPPAVDDQPAPADDEQAGPEPAPASDIVDAEDVDDPADLPEGQTVEVGSFGQIDLHVKDLPLTQVLRLLSIQGERNIIASRQVSGNVSADLYGVDFYEALDAILHTNGFGYIERGNFIYVYTQEEIERREQAARRTVTRILRLSYIPASDASAFVSPLLSPDGSISVSADAPAGMAPGSDAGRNSFAHADTLIVRDYPENVDEIFEVLDELDVRPKQVLIEATILQARLGEANAFGVDFAIFADLDLADFTTPLGAVNDLITGEAANGGAITSSPGNVQTGESSIKLGYAGSDAAVFIRALDSVTDTTVLATPKILALNRQRAELLVGEKLGYLSTTQTETAATQTVEFLDIGTQLTVRPFISEDEHVRLELRPSVSDGQTELRGGIIIPNQTTQELTTNVIVRSGQTVVLGGLFKEDTVVGRRQVPGLGDVPLVGGLFRGQDDSFTRSEVIFLIKPTVLRDEALNIAGERVSDSIESARVGARRSLLPWSRQKLTGSHLSKAHEHIQDGENDKAMWNVNVALHLNPTSIDALRLKEQLTGERIALPDTTILRDAVDTMIDSQIDLAPEPIDHGPIEIGDDGDDDDADADDQPAGGADAQSDMLDAEMQDVVSESLDETDEQ